MFLKFSNATERVPLPRRMRSIRGGEVEFGAPAGGGGLSSFPYFSSSYYHTFIFPNVFRSKIPVNFQKITWVLPSFAEFPWVNVTRVFPSFAEFSSLFFFSYDNHFISRWPPFIASKKRKLQNRSHRKNSTNSSILEKNRQNSPKTRKNFEKLRKTPKNSPKLAKTRKKKSIKKLRN